MASERRTVLFHLSARLAGMLDTLVVRLGEDEASKRIEAAITKALDEAQAKADPEALSKPAPPPEIWRPTDGT